MKVLMIDDQKTLNQFDLSRFKIKSEDVVFARNYSDGCNLLESQESWDIVLIDYDLKEFSINRNGYAILRRCRTKIDKVLIITSDLQFQKKLVELCVELKDKNIINTFYCLNPLF